MSKRSDNSKGRGDDTAPEDLVRGGRFDSVLQAVEQAASGILEEAETEAKRRIDAAEARADVIARERAAEAARFSDLLLDRAHTVRERADEFLAAIDDAIASLDQEAPQAQRRAEPTSSKSEPAAEVRESAAPSDQTTEPVEEVTEPVEEAPAPPDEARPPLQEAPALPEEPAVVPEDPASQEEAAAQEEAGEPLRKLRERLTGFGRPPQQVPLRPPNPPQATPTRVEGKPSEGAVLLATQMAVAGASREQIEARLRDDFGIEDPGPILERMGA